MNSKRSAYTSFAAFSCLGLITFSGSVALAASPAQNAIPKALEVFQSEPVAAFVSPALRDLPPRHPGASRQGSRRQRIARSLPGTLGGVEQPIDLLPQPDSFRAPDKRTPNPSQVFDGIQFTGTYPPDPVGDVGLNHYVQAVNTDIAVFDKNGNQLVAPHAMGDLWAGSGNDCNSDGGDPVILYDTVADRWFASQLGSQTNAVCIAVSKTPDPGGQYSVYRFAVPNLPDYLKFGVWPDAYYMGDNENSYVAYAFDRAKMLAGQPATFQRFAGETNLMLPADLDGPAAPPAGSPEYFYTFKDDQEHGGADRLEVFEFHVDWATPANSTFKLVSTLPIMPINYTVCGAFAFNCISQKGTNQRLDSISEWPMFRLQYRNFGAYQSLVGNFTYDVDNTNHAGIRWFELRKMGAGGWTLQQEGTHSPDALSRFVGSAAMDKVGNIALGYTASGSASFPDIRYATRQVDDPPGTLQAEVTMKASGGSQTGVERWGDYSAMTVDPVDDCTFFYTTEYIPTQGGGWNTVVGKFKMPNCGGKNVGETCAGSSDCKSGFCADGVCCSTDCGNDTQDCQVCSVAAGATADGTCTARAAGVSCRPAADTCDKAEVCDGTAKTCPADAFQGATTVCRPAAAPCDAPETCSGTSAACPADAIAKAGDVCRPALSSCDVEEVCDGAATTCPTDVTGADGATCEAGGTCKAGECVPPLKLDPQDDGSCGCRVPGHDAGDTQGRAATLFAMLGLALAGGLRRRGKARRS